MYSPSHVGRRDVELLISVAMFGSLNNSLNYKRLSNVIRMYI